MTINLKLVIMTSYYGKETINAEMCDYIYDLGKLQATTYSAKK